LAASDAAELETTAELVELTPGEVSARRWQLHVIALIVIGIDQLTKTWAVGALSDGTIHEGPFGSQLRLVYNTGSAFSLGAGLGPVFAVLAIAVSIAMFFIVRRIESRAVVFGLGLVQGGALGNVLDRMFRDGDGFLRGPVVDFLEAGDWWPVFNIADVAIVVGGIIVVLLGSRE
jgi:signal peptidase II